MNFFFLLIHKIHKIFYLNHKLKIFFIEKKKKKKKEKRLMQI